MEIKPVAPISLADLTDIHIHQEKKWDRRELVITVSALYQGKEYGVTIPIKLKDLVFRPDGTQAKMLENFLQSQINHGLEQVCKYIQKHEDYFKHAVKKLRIELCSTT
jgi:hypothetical protein